MSQRQRLGPIDRTPGIPGSDTSESTCHVDDCSACHIDVREEVSDEVWWDDEGEADEEEKSDEDEEVGGEEGVSQVSVVGDMGWVKYKWRA